MKVAIILNGISLKKKYFYHSFLPPLKKIFKIDVFETLSKNHAIDLAAKAVLKKYDVIIAAGGDGTVNQVINGVLQESSAKSLPVVAVLPIGSGNDFVRNIKFSLAPDSFIDALRNFQTFDVDVGEIICKKAKTGEETHLRYFVNVADVGMGPEVVMRVRSGDQTFGSAAAYYRAILSTFASYKPPMLYADGDTWEWKDHMRTFAIANGKCFGSGLCIAPDAKLDDGLFNVFASGPLSVLDFILQSVPLKNGKKINHSMVKYFTSTRVKLSSDVPLAIEADGELCGWLPASLQLSSVKLKVLRMG